MGKIVSKDNPCLDQVECQSSDGMQVYDDGSGFCFSCHQFWSKSQVDSADPADVRRKTRVSDVDDEDEFQPQMTVERAAELPIRGLRDRGIPKDICEFFGVRVSYGSDGEIDQHFYPHGHGYNVRKVAEKKFYRVGDCDDLCGADKFSGGGRRVVVTEGEPDMLSVAYATRKKWGTIYPVVTMGSSANTGLLLKRREWLRTFDEVVLWFDNDDAGKDALDKAIKIIGFDKIKIAKHPVHKDANAVQMADGWEAVLRPIFDAEKFVPAGIISRAVLKERMRLLNSVHALPYPACMAGVNKNLKGMRTGEIALFTSGTGSGKSTLVREIILEIKAQTDEKIGYCALEESPEAEAKRMSGMQLSRNTAKDDMEFEELEVGFDELFGKEDEEERIMMLDHQGSISDASIVDKIEYMCLMGCKYIVIDHITILVSEGVDKLQGNEAQDKIMNQLLSLVKRYPVWIGLISHLRKVGQGAVSFEEGKLPTMDDIKGSGSIKQISFDIIAFARDLNAASEVERNTIKMAVLKARTTGLTGRVNGAIYDHDTGRLRAEPERDALANGEDEVEDFSKVETTWTKS